MSQHYPLMIPSASPDGDPAVVEAPFDRSQVATVDQAGEAAVEQALATAHHLYKDRDGWLTPAERIEILVRAAHLLEARQDELALEAAREGGKPLADSKIEAGRAVDGLWSCVETIRTQAGREIPMRVNDRSAHRYATTHFEPLGPVLAFSAFNHPLNLIVHQVATAVAAGCPVLVKPAAATPLSCYRFVDILREAGLPPDWCQAFITTNHDVSAKLVADSRVSFFTFIGSASVGWKLRSQLAPGTRCALEHGGVAPAILAADADLDDVLPLLARAGFYHAGQVCVSLQKLFVQKEIARDVAERFAKLAQDMTVGDPTEEATDVGPLIRPGEVERVGNWVSDANAETLCGGKAISETCYAPTVLFDPPSDAQISTEEVFGPVVCVYPFDELDEAIERANSLPYAFQAAVCTRDVDTALRASRRLDAATVMVNDHTAFRVDWMPFYGYRESGLGVGGIPYSIHDMQVEKLVVWRSKEL